MFIGAALAQGPWGLKLEWNHWRHNFHEPGFGPRPLRCWKRLQPLSRIWIWLNGKVPKPSLYAVFYSGKQCLSVQYIMFYLVWFKPQSFFNWITTLGIFKSVRLVLLLPQRRGHDPVLGQRLWPLLPLHLRITTRLQFLLLRKIHLPLSTAPEAPKIQT